MAQGGRLSESRPPRKPRGLQENVRARSADRKCRAADKLNLELRGHISIDVAVQHTAGIPKRTGSAGRGAFPGKDLVAGYQRIGVDISQIDLIAQRCACSRKPGDDIASQRIGALAHGVVVKPIVVRATI